MTRTMSACCFTVWAKSDMGRMVSDTSRPLC
jgi:hypothetical protein